MKRKLIEAAAGAAALLVLILWLSGSLSSGKVRPGAIAAGTRAMPKTAPVVANEIADRLEWPGTVRSRTVVHVAPKFLAAILEVRVSVGSPVKSDDVLAVLDDRDLLARRRQAAESLDGAESDERLANSELARVEGLFQKQAATPRDLDAAKSAAEGAAARVRKARAAVEEIDALLRDTILRAPIDGVVTDKLAEAGDLGVPGRPILVIQDPKRLRLEAHVPESCATKARYGMKVTVLLDVEVEATIDEISPTADPVTRTFLIKAALPERPGLKPGQYGRILQACGSHRALLIPASAVTRSGQVEMVTDGEGHPRHVRTGKTYGDRVEVRSGLREGERVVIP